jgi:hypothetical protein
MGGTGARERAYLQPLNLSRGTLGPATPKPDKSHRKYSQIAWLMISAGKRWPA